MLTSAHCMLTSARCIAASANCFFTLGRCMLTSAHFIFTSGGVSIKSVSTLAGAGVFLSESSGIRATADHVLFTSAYARETLVPLLWAIKPCKSNLSQRSIKVKWLKK